MSAHSRRFPFLGQPFKQLGLEQFEVFLDAPPLFVERPGPGLLFEGVHRP